MPEQGWLIFGFLAWIVGYLQSKFAPKTRMLEIPLIIFIICGLPSGFKSREISFEGFRLQLLGLLLAFIPSLKNFIQVSDVYLLLGSLGISTVVSFLLIQLQD